MIGVWSGTYKHESESLPKEINNQVTNFKIEIASFDGIRFSGTVEDDLTTGGTRGLGTITGKLIGNKVSFIKRMPVLTYYISGEKREVQNQPHGKIYYEGELVDNVIKGTWRIKFSFRFVNRTFLIFKGNSGVWRMEKL